jgi:hypothetical protein
MIALAVAIGVILALPCGAAALARIAGAVALGAALAAPTIAVMARIAAASARASGFAPEVVLAHSVHPLTLVQVAVAGFYGDTARITEHWWGGNFFPRGFPYFLSLYLGLAAIVLAAVGAGQEKGPRRRLAAIAIIAVLLALGRWGPGAWIVDALEAARRFRYPSKLFFATHLAVALLVGLGVDALANGVRSAWRRMAVASLAVGVVLASAPLWPLLAPESARWFAAGFFAPGRQWPAHLALLDWVLGDAATGAAVALAAGVLALLAWRGRVAPRPAALGHVALLAADLLRAGAGLNPATSAGFFTPTPELARHHPAWRAAGRVFTCDPPASAAYARGRAMRADHERWTFAVLRDTAAPSFNVGAQLASALSPDLTMLVPPERLIDFADAGCASVDRLIGPWRVAGVAHVISLDPLSHPDLRLQSSERPPALAPLTVFAYAVADPRPMVSLGSPPESGGTADLRRNDPGHIEVLTSARVHALLVVREAGGAGWSAFVDGQPTPFARAERGHLAVEVPAGTHTATFDYRPPGFQGGVWIAALGLMAAIALLIAPRRARPDKARVLA